MAKYSIIPISPEDFSTIANFIWISKQYLTINRLLWKDWPNEAAQRALYDKTIESTFENPLFETFKAVDDENGEIVGHVVLGRKKPVDNEKKDAGKDDKGDAGAPEGIVPEVLTAVDEAVKEIGKDLEGIDHFQLVHIFVVLPCRNKGIGSQLVKLCFDRAKAERLPLALVSEPQAHRFHLKLEFEDTKHVDIDLRKWAQEYYGFGLFRLWGMVWKN